MIKKENIECKLLVDKSGDLLLMRRKQELPPSGKGYAKYIKKVVQW